MAPMDHPRRAMVLAGALMLAACEPSALDDAPAQMQAQTEITAAAQAPTAGGQTAESALVASGMHQLVAMSAPVSEDGTLGAGCADEEAEGLPDGDWYAFVLDYERIHVTVDIACVYGPDTDQFEAYLAMEGEEAERSVLTNHVVINDLVHERRLRLATDAQAYLASTQWEPISATGFAQAAAPGASGADRGVWLRVEDGLVTAVAQPYASGLAAG